MLINCCNPKLKQMVPFDKIKISMPDSWTGKSNSQINLQLVSGKKEIGFVFYIPSTGEIKRMWVNPEYNQKYYYGVLVNEVIKDIKELGGSICWVLGVKSNNFWKSTTSRFVYTDSLIKKPNLEGFYIKI